MISNELVYFYNIFVKCKKYIETLKQVNCVSVKMKKIVKPMIVVQDLRMTATIHLKLCQSWRKTAKVLGPAIIVLHAIFYCYCFFPLVYFDYLLSRLKYEMAPVVFILFFAMMKLMSILSSLKCGVRIQQLILSNHYFTQ